MQPLGRCNALWYCVPHSNRQKRFLPIVRFLSRYIRRLECSITRYPHRLRAKGQGLTDLTPVATLLLMIPQDLGKNAPPVHSTTFLPLLPNRLQSRPIKASSSLVRTHPHIHLPGPGEKNDDGCATIVQENCTI